MPAHEVDDRMPLLLPLGESLDSALPLESKMLGFRQPAELTRRVFDRKMKAHTRYDEIHGNVVEGADASLLCVLVLAISLRHPLLPTNAWSAAHCSGQAGLLARSPTSPFMLHGTQVAREAVPAQHLRRQSLSRSSLVS